MHCYLKACVEVVAKRNSKGLLADSTIEKIMEFQIKERIYIFLEKFNFNSVFGLTTPKTSITSLLTHFASYK